MSTPIADTGWTGPTRPTEQVSTEQISTGSSRAARRTGLILGAAVLAVTATFSMITRNSVPTMLVDLGIEAVASVLVYAIVVPYGLARRVAGAGTVVLGVSAVVTVLYFFTGLPLVLGVAVVVVGAGDRHRSTRSRVAVVAGLLGVLGYFVSYATDAFPHG